jgi:hypothetical protein
MTARLKGNLTARLLRKRQTIVFHKLPFSHPAMALCISKCSKPSFKSAPIKVTYKLVTRLNVDGPRVKKRQKKVKGKKTGKKENKKSKANWT